MLSERHREIFRSRDEGNLHTASCQENKEVLGIQEILELVLLFPFCLWWVTEHWQTEITNCNHISLGIVTCTFLNPYLYGNTQL